MTQEFAEHLIVRPTLHHFGIATGNLEAMVDWYGKVVGMVIVHQSARPWESKPDAYLGSAFVSNDTAHHRIAINALPGLKDDTDRYHAKFQHVAFEYQTIDDLLNTYTRLKGLLIEPVLSTDHGPSIAFYYADPDGNNVELFVDTFGDRIKSFEYLRTSPDFHKNPMGTLVDPQKLVEARKAGMTFAELNQRAYAGEFAPATTPDPRVLL